MTVESSFEVRLDTRRPVTGASPNSQMGDMLIEVRIYEKEFKSRDWVKSRVVILNL